MDHADISVRLRHEQQMLPVRLFLGWLHRRMPDVCNAVLSAYSARLHLPSRIREDVRGRDVSAPRAAEGFHIDRWMTLLIGSALAGAS